MENWIFIALLAALAGLILVVLARTAAFKPQKTEKPIPSPVDTDEAKIVSDMQQLIRCKTVSHVDPDKAAPPEEFEKLRALLKDLFPIVHEKATCERIGPSGILYHLKGRHSDKPAVFMAHYDVVPANEEAWQKPAFEGIVENGELWGRGTLDTKVTLLSVMESAEALLRGGFLPENDFYFSFSGDEEIGGSSTPAIVRVLEERGIHPALVLDEGGAVTEHVFPGISQPCALIGTGEKGRMNVEFSATSNGGHASVPPPHTLVGLLSKACAAVESKPFPFRITKPVQEMFDTLGRHSSFFYRMIFSNLWLFHGVLNLICKKRGGELNALMRTTAAFTIMEGSKSANVLPPKARMVANLRLIGGDTTKSVIERLQRTIADNAIDVRTILSSEPSKYSNTNCDAWRKLSCAVSETWPDAIVSPYLMIACTDSRHFCRICDSVYRFSAMALTTEQRSYIHGNNERIPLDTLVQAVAFYIRLMRTL